MAASYWLLKSEPDVFSIEALRRGKRTHWEGVRNYQARNHLRAMKGATWSSSIIPMPTRPE